MPWVLFLVQETFSAGVRTGDSFIKRGKYNSGGKPDYFRRM